MHNRTRQNEHSASRHAFTLIEAIIAIVILATAIPAMFWAISDAQSRRAEPIQTTRARWLATEKLEDIIADRHSSTRGWSYIAGGNYPAEASISGFPGFSRATSIIETASDLSTAGTGFRVVTVTVSYSGRSGASRSMAVKAVLTEYTP